MLLKNTFSQHSFLKTTKEIETETRRPNFEFSNVIFSRKTRSKNEEEEEEEEKDSSRIDRAL